MIHTMISQNLLKHVYCLSRYIDSKFKDKTPSQMILISCVSFIALKILSDSCKLRWGQTRREQIGNLALRIGFIRQKYNKDVQKELVHYQKATEEKWKVFGELRTQIPEKPLSYKELIQFVEDLSQIVLKEIKDNHYSGTIYSKSLDTEDKSVELTTESLDLMPEDPLNDADYFGALANKLRKASLFASDKAKFWNALHSDEFPGSWLERQVVCMVGHMFGAVPCQIKGTVTNGGTGSLMLAVLGYRNLAMKTKKHEPGEGIVLASKSVHAAIEKSNLAYLVQVIFIETDEMGRMVVKDLKNKLDTHGNKVIVVIASAPPYPLGVMDPIKEIGELAEQYKKFVHVDCCLGAYVVNNLPQHDTQFLQMPGITSLSADTHKNGLAPKGSSVLVTKNVGDHNLLYYFIYAIPNWEGGVYGTPKNEGSQPCLPALDALLSMLGTGQEGYKRMAKLVHGKALELAESIRKYPKELKLIAEPEVNVVAFQINQELGLPEGATYAFAKEMKNKKEGRRFVLNTLKGDKVHFCVTLRSATNPNFIKDFEEAVRGSLDALAIHNDNFLLNGTPFPGDAGMYCALSAAMAPDIRSLSLFDFLKNKLCGPQGARDTVRAYFLALADPFTEGGEFF
jgi:glutamate/tyrosine decarboxylase-like PLP-dependent enzyme